MFGLGELSSSFSRSLTPKIINDLARSRSFDDSFKKKQKKLMPSNTTISAWASHHNKRVGFITPFKKNIRFDLKIYYWAFIRYIDLFNLAIIAINVRCFKKNNNRNKFGRYKGIFDAMTGSLSFFAFFSFRSAIKRIKKIK